MAAALLRQAQVAMLPQSQGRALLAPDLRQSYQLGQPQEPAIHACIDNLSTHQEVYTRDRAEGSLTGLYLVDSGLQLGRTQS